MEEALITAKELCKSFNSEGVLTQVLTHVNLSIRKGDFTVIMGSSGSGKSTLLYTLSRMDTITSGTVFYKNTDIGSLKENDIVNLHKKEFGFVFQQMHLISNLTILENILIHGYLNKEVPENEVNDYSKELASQMGITDILDRYPSQVSGGERQRASIARALIARPALVFADEPTGALNKRTGTEVLNLLTDINRAGQSVLMVTHDLRASIRANRILYLEDGEICGEMNLPPYKKEEVTVREKQVTCWLSERGW